MNLASCAVIFDLGHSVSDSCAALYCVLSYYLLVLLLRHILGRGVICCAIYCA